MNSKNRLRKMEGGTLNKNKKVLLQDHTSKIEQKLARLKLEVDEKRNAIDKNRFIATTKQTPKTKVLEKRNSASGIRLARNAVSNKMMSQPQIQKTKQSQGLKLNKDIFNFLRELGFDQYDSIFEENGIDGLSILQEIKQKQLQQIGVQKGHALKITVKLKKMKQQKQKKANPSSKQNTLQQQPKQQKNQPLQIIIQTDSFNEENSLPAEIKKRRYFCLNCYKVSDNNFCNEDCQFLYNKMFEKYEKNLIKIEQAFLHKEKKQEKEEEVDEYLDGMDILEILEGDENEENQFNQEAYQQAMQAIHLAKTQNSNNTQQATTN